MAAVAATLMKDQEACKYVVKPADLLDLTAPELKSLHEQLFKLHLVQALVRFGSSGGTGRIPTSVFHRVTGPLGSKLITVPT